MTTLKNIIEDNQTRWGRIFDLIVQLLIIVCLVSFSLETLPNNSVEMKFWLYVIEVFCVVFFTMEYLLRIIVSDKPLSFVFSFFGIIDLISIIPFYLALGFDLRSVRAFRMLRLFRAFKIVRYSKAIDRFTKAFTIAKEEIILFLFITSILLYLASVGIYYFENGAQPDKFSSVFDAMWWSVTTLTTVGYGDVYPITIGGKIFTFFILMIGLGIVSIPAGLIASAFAKVRRDEDSEAKLKSAPTE